MKRLFIVVVVGLLLGGTALFAEESVLIDFTQLYANQDIATGKVYALTDLAALQATPPQNRPHLENAPTIIDYSNVAGASFSDADKALMKSSLALNNWQVVLASSARSVANQSVTMTKEAMTTPTAPDFNGQPMKDLKILGVRVHFPTEPFNSWAEILPPFDIPAYADKDSLQTKQGGGTEMVVKPEDKGKGEKFDGFGVVKNVGVLKSLSITVHGSNFPNGLGVVVADQDGKQQTMFMDYLLFDGWRTLTWNNPNYVSDVRNRQLRTYPLYPKGMPYLKLVGIVIYRDASQEGGDFVTYFKDIKITYDKAIIPSQQDINDESIWHILQQRQEARRLAELRRLGNQQVLRFLEQQKMDQSTPPAQ